MTFINGTDLASETLIFGYSNKGFIEIWNVSYSSTNERLVTTVAAVNKPNEKAQAGVLSFTKMKSKSSGVFFTKCMVLAL